MAPPAAAASKGGAKLSLKTETGLSQFNDSLEGRSYVDGGNHPTQADLTRFAEIQRLPDSTQFPHVVRWFRHIAAHRRTFADSLGPRAAKTPAPAAAPKAAAAGGKPAAAAAPRERKQLVIDCESVPVTETRVPAAVHPPYGAGAASFAGTAHKAEKYYITTAIMYCNGWAHIGHAYESLTSDAFARLHRMMGKDVFFMTGSDEHGQKIAQTAEGMGMTPIAICDQYVDGFKALNQRLCVSNDFYVRTTSDQHKEVARTIWNMCKERGDIYLDRYEGWYSVREERFVTDTEAAEWDFKDPTSGDPLKKMSEPSFFFKLAKYAPLVLKHIEENEKFVQPQTFRTEILERLRGMEMRDLCISRGTFDWGIECPEDKVDGEQHVMYVWFDALINYISGIDGIDPAKPLSRFWPADMHIIGKDISWFHSVIWPAMLMSAEIKLPTSIVVHGFISGPDGRKMSKSLGNVVDPHDMLNRLPCDTLRWYLCRESAFGEDVKFSEASLVLMHNSDLCDNLGNLVNRAVNLCGGQVPKGDSQGVPLPFDLEELKAATVKALEWYRLSEVADLAIRACSSTNKWIADLEPWKMKDAGQQEHRSSILRVLIEAVYVLAHFFSPFIPTAGAAIFEKVGQEPRPIPELRNDFMNLTSGAPVVSNSVLFAVMDVAAASGGSPTAAVGAGAAPGTGPGKGSADEAKKLGSKEPAAKAEAKTEAKPKSKSKKKAEPLTPDDPNQPLFSKLDVRVGKVVKAWPHPDAERLYVEEIDVGDADGPRTIVSGLREHYSLEEFQGKKLLAVCNMVPSKLRGVTSHGMVLCAKDQDAGKVELLSVPDDCPVGTRVLPDGTEGKWSAVVPANIKEYKVWETVAAELKADVSGVAGFAGNPLVAGKGSKFKFSAPTLRNVAIS